MRVYAYKPGDEPKLSECVLALGFFDGVHLAHRALIRKAREEADKRGLLCAVFTFSSEENIIKNGARRIYGTEEKLRIFEELSVDACIVANFASIANTSAEDFVKETIVGDLCAKVAVCGYNFRFGKGAVGNASLLSDIMKNIGLDALIIDELSYGQEPISSTRIREKIRNGSIREANEMLGGAYFFSGVVSHGRGEGRTLGFPTVNTELPATREIPRFGVYKTEIPINGKIYTGLTNIGTCPTFGERSAHLETYILDYDGDLYGKRLDVLLVDFIREEKRFKNKEELIMQINIDKNAILNQKNKRGTMINERELD